MSFGANNDFLQYCLRDSNNAQRVFLDAMLTSLIRHSALCTDLLNPTNARLALLRSLGLANGASFHIQYVLVILSSAAIHEEILPSLLDLIGGWIVY